MLIGAMNHPAHDVLEELEWIAEMGFDFVDLTLEPPLARAERVNPTAIRAFLDARHLTVVGHTAYYLPISSGFESLRLAAVDELRACLRVFAKMGAKWMNLHPDREAPMFGRQFVVEQNRKSIYELLPLARELGVGLMIENLPGGFNTRDQLADLLDSIPELALHLDIGHANLFLDRNSSAEILGAYGDRLRHVHLHDNKGGNADLHLPLGTGTIDLIAQVRALKASGYDGTITLEVFSPDKRHLQYSKELLRNAWDTVSAD